MKFVFEKEQSEEREDSKAGGWETSPKASTVTCVQSGSNYRDGDNNSSHLLAFMEYFILSCNKP